MLFRSLKKKLAIWRESRSEGGIKKATTHGYGTGLSSIFGKEIESSENRSREVRVRTLECGIVKGRVLAEFFSKLFFFR